MLFSTLSFTVEKHYCGDFLVDVSYVGKADTCNQGNENDCKTIIKKNKCCKDEVYQIDGQDEIQKFSLEKISFDKVALPITFHTFYQWLFQDIEKQTTSYEYYSPPELFFDIQVLHEVFII